MNTTIMLHPTEDELVKVSNVCGDPRIRFGALCLFFKSREQYRRFLDTLVQFELSQPEEKEHEV